MSSLNRRSVLQGGLGAALTSSLPALAQDAALPLTKLVSGFPAGGAIDAVSRRLADSLRGSVADTVIVENKPGAGGRIAINALKAGPSDGSQWLVTPGSMLVIYPHVYKKLSYDPERDLLPVTQIANVPLALAVGPAVPASVVDVKSYVAWMKEDPSHTNIGTPAAGNITHFLAFLLGKASGVALGYIPFRGSAPAIQDLLGGQLPALINPITEMLPHLAGGKLRVLGVTSRERSSFLPQARTFIEQGYPSVVGSEWMGLFVRPGTAPRLVEKMATGVRAALRTPAVRETFEKLALEPADETGPQLARRIHAEIASWREVSRAFGFELDD